MLTNKQYTGIHSTTDCESFDGHMLTNTQKRGLEKHLTNHGTIVNLDAVSGNQYRLRIIDGKCTTIIDPEIDPDLIDDLVGIMDVEMQASDEQKNQAAITIIKHLQRKELLK